MSQPRGILPLRRSSANSSGVSYAINDGASAVLCEFIQGVLIAGGGATGDSCIVEVFEMRKPF